MTLPPINTPEAHSRDLPLYCILPFSSRTLEMTALYARNTSSRHSGFAVMMTNPTTTSFLRVLIGSSRDLQTLKRGFVEASERLSDSSHVTSSVPINGFLRRCTP